MEETEAYSGKEMQEVNADVGIHEDEVGERVSDTGGVGDADVTAIALDFRLAAGGVLGGTQRGVGIRTRRRCST